MTETGRDALRRLFAVGYDDLRSRLARRLGSADLAGDALHEAYLRIDQAPAIGPVRNPKFYLLRVAINIAWKRLRREDRIATLSDAVAMLGIADDAPGPARTAEARAELERLRQAIADLTPRRREILLASRIDGIPLRKIAEELGVSQRLVEIELKHALAHCALRLDRTVVRRFGPGAGRGSH